MKVVVTHYEDDYDYLIGGPLSHLEEQEQPEFGTRLLIFNEQTGATYGWETIRPATPADIAAACIDCGSLDTYGDDVRCERCEYKHQRAEEQRRQIDNDSDLPF